MDSREIILKILIDININGAYSNISINKYLKKTIRMWKMKIL